MGCEQVVQGMVCITGIILVGCIFFKLVFYEENPYIKEAKRNITNLKYLQKYRGMLDKYRNQNGLVSFSTVEQMSSKLELEIRVLKQSIKDLEDKIKKGSSGA